MESELAACPVCGSSVTQPGNSDVYCVDCNYKNHVGDHNTLARRAEIGALVERIVDAAPGLLTIGRTAMTDGVTIYSAWSSKPFTDERSLLEALRALAAEIGGER